MFLAMLNDKEKEIFLGLAYNLVVADGIYSIEEKTVMKEYCKEMQCTFDDSRKVSSVDELLQELQSLNIDITKKKIYVFELIGLAMADGYYHENERTIIDQLRKKMSVGEEFAKQCEDEISKYFDFQSKINMLVLG